MKVMIKFEIEVLKTKTYAGLTEMYNNLIYSVKIGNQLKEHYRVNGEITEAAKVEASIIRINENIDAIKLVMMSKESDALESLSFGMEPISLN